MQETVLAHHLAVLQALTRLPSLQVQAMDQFTPKKAGRKKREYKIKLFGLYCTFSILYVAYMIT